MIFVFYCNRLNALMCVEKMCTLEQMTGKSFYLYFRLKPLLNNLGFLTFMGKKPFENIVEKGENAGNQHFLFFPQCLLCCQYH